ncbi:uncharacterized protein FOMMEDRAFT_88895 [Fomitiporia mediterranea MF3/22]|uniref:uncharacterized protein n=1 Tax=Fomitiporia mediterranea (strain MF3/22) TaxID=694068 RepID=UPI0004409A8F|nr:uncharacterized protein FOMMEDRAFT_88895 [Fomitiporia mediterranea MF3/22]EJD01447.1 hypothetical protein FOMMEDRAFT_88895 [Fomitiporia mediterranea MF3/22]
MTLRGVLLRLIVFAISLAVVPLSTYYGTQRFVWKGDSTFAAISAVFVANVVLVAYIAISVYEDKQQTAPRRVEGKADESKKEK